MNIQDYLNLPYNIIVRHVVDESGTYYFARVQELPGCMSDGETIEEAFANIYEAIEGWIETKIEAGLSIPLPMDTEKYSGKFVVRIPKSLHAKLAIEAEQEGISLNQYALYKLAHA
ncbi:MAG: type II toxin-antitoxin system HicB family antitoxin [Oscillospiraceae bacterium]|jgi:predicted RNase H-like HicB family nuclease|nr:type II toxin-antitoxin system HicB family antitoxin [Oscillospiraceae bacterium]